MELTPASASPGPFIVSPPAPLMLSVTTVAPTFLMWQCQPFWTVAGVGSVTVIAPAFEKVMTFPLSLAWSVYVVPAWPLIGAALFGESCSSWNAEVASSVTRYHLFG